MSVNEPALPDLPARLRMLKRGTAVQVRWLHTAAAYCGYGGGWLKNREPRITEHCAVGYFFAVTDDALIVAEGAVRDGADGPCTNACTAIPVVALRSLRVLK